ncbi:nucleotidyltransferase [Nanoarchaeota archaeon]
MEQKQIQSEILNKIKQIILDTANNYNIKIHKIILFGSRARGDYREDSDWDILIVTEDKLDWNIKKKILGELIGKFADYYLDTDILIIDKEEFNKKKEDIGYVYYWANKEGIII